MIDSVPKWRDGSPRGALLLAVIVAVGLGLRCVGLASSFWVDEVDTLQTILRQSLGEIVTSYASENKHPLYSVLARLSVDAFGANEVAMRLPALLLGLASLWAVARLGRQLLDETTGLLAALLLAVSAHHVSFSQNARGYTGMLLFTVLATSEFLRLLSAPTRGARWRYALFAALAVYTHLTAAFAFSGHALVWAALWWRDRRGPDSAARASAAGRSLVDCTALPPARATSAALFAMAGAAALGLLLYLPMLGDLVAAFTARAQGAGASVAKVEPWTSPAWAVQQAVTSLGGSWLAFGGLAFAAVLAIVGAASLWRNGRRRFVLMHLLAPPIALGFLLLLHRHLYPRFFFFEAGFAAIALVRGARISGGWLSCNLPGCKVQRTQLWGVAVVMVVAAASALSLDSVYAHPRQDFVGARAAVEARAGPGDVKVAVGAAKLVLPGWYAPEWRIADTAAELAALRSSGAVTWLVHAQSEQLAAARPDLWTAVERDFPIVVELPGSLGGSSVWVRRAAR